VTDKSPAAPANQKVALTQSRLAYNPRRRPATRPALVAAIILVLGGSVPVLPTTAAAETDPASGVEVIGAARTGGIERVVEILTRDLGLPLPRATRVHVYTTPQAFRRGLVKDGAIREEAAFNVASFAIGIARPAHVLVHSNLAGGGSEWLRLIAHEMTHVSQFELAGGEGRAEQWLAEGTAEHVAFQVLERLDVGSLALHRRVALARVPQHPAFAHGRLELNTLGSPHDFMLRHQREGSVETYHLSFLLADYLIAQHGFDKMIEYFSRLKRQSSEAAFQAAFGYSIATFETQALAHLQVLAGTAN